MCLHLSWFDFLTFDQELIKSIGFTKLLTLMYTIHPESITMTWSRSYQAYWPILMIRQPQATHATSNQHLCVATLRTGQTCLTGHGNMGLPPVTGQVPRQTTRLAHVMDTTSTSKPLHREVPTTQHVWSAQPTHLPTVSHAACSSSTICTETISAPLMCIVFRKITQPTT